MVLCSKKEKRYSKQKHSDASEYAGIYEKLGAENNQGAHDH